MSGQLPWRPDSAGELSLNSPQPANRPPELRSALGVVGRNRWLIAVCVAGALAAGAVATRLVTPTYEATAAIQIDTKQGTLPGVYTSLQTGTEEIATGIEVLRSRTLAEAVVDSLGLGLRVLEPARVPRSAVLNDVQLARTATSAAYTLSRNADSSFSVFVKDSTRQIALARIGQRVDFGGVSFMLPSAAHAYAEITLGVSGFDETVDALRETIEIGRTGREANIVQVTYQTSDPVLARDVVNALAARFVSRRNNLQKTEARSTAAFLQQQIDTVSRELSAAERELRQFRERERVVNPEVEGTSEVTRLAQLRAERSAMDAERRALGEQLGALDAQARVQPADAPSVYRRLLGFPTLLKNQAAASYLGALNAVEAERVTLLTRRTAQDPDVMRLSARVRELEEQLHVTATTYLAGLTNQVNSLDVELARSGRQLAAIPGKEVQFARLQREPKVLADMVTLLQTRLKEAQIAQAMEDPSVQILDRAVAPRLPLRPRPATDLALAGGIGLLLGVTAAFTRERLDRSVRNRADALLAAGAPVLGIVPRFVATRSGESLRAGPLARFGGARNNSGKGMTTEGSADAPHPRSITEAYARVFMNITWNSATQGAAPRGAASLVITSPLPGDGKTTTAANMAITLAQRGYRVVLVDADMRRGQIGILMHTPNGAGLAEVLRGTANLETTIRATEVGYGKTLQYLTAGAPPSQAAALLQSTAMRTLDDQLRRNYDVVIYDTPPLNAVSDAAILGTIADGVLLVARAGVTPTQSLTFAAEQLRIARARLHGVLLNDVELKRDAAYDDAFKYYGENDAYHHAPGG